MVSSTDGRSVEARAMLDPGSTASFITERLASVLRLPRSRQAVHLTGITGATTGSSTQAVTSCKVSPIYGNGKPLDIMVVVLPKLTRDIPTSQVLYQHTWNHIDDLNLADPTFGEPGRIDALLGVEVYINMLRDGRRLGPPGTPTALETGFGWVLCGNVEEVKTNSQVSSHVVVNHLVATSIPVDDLLKRFWEIEETPADLILTQEEKSVLQQFETTHSRTPEGRFVVTLPRKQSFKPLGESRSQAVRRFQSLERSLHQKDRFCQVNQVIQEYLDLGHAEAVPRQDLEKNQQQVFYLPIHVVYKTSSTSTKVRAVFDASAKTSFGVSLNDTLMVGPTVHPPLVDVLLRFRTHQVALTTDVSKMYRAVSLTDSDKDYHRFIWRKEMDEPLQDYRMTRVTFGVAASSFAANMAVQMNAQELSQEFPQAAKATQESFYVDDGLTGADTIQEAIQLRIQLQCLFSRACFQLRKWNSNEAQVLDSVPSELREAEEVLSMSDSGTGVAKTLGIEWDTRSDSFNLATSEFILTEIVSKRILLSDVSKVFDALGWFSPTTIQMKIVLQRTWELNIGWDDQVPDHLLEKWKKWRSELPILTSTHLERCYYLKDEILEHVEVHGFSDASEEAYAAVTYLRSTYTSGKTHVSLIMAKSKVAPIKRQSIPRLELCGALMLSRILKHLKRVLLIPTSCIYAWTDSTIVLDWLRGSPR